MTPQILFAIAMSLMVASLPASMLGWRKLFTALSVIGVGIIGAIAFIWHPIDMDVISLASFNLGTFHVELGLTWLSSLFAIILSIGCLLGLVHGYFYLDNSTKGIRSHGFFLALLVISLQLTVLARDALMLFFAWELMGFSSFFSILVERDKATWKAAKYYLIFMQTGAAVLLTGIAMAFHHTGSLSFDKWINLPTLNAIILIVGFAFKAGFFPFHPWLPVAHPMAPGHVSGMMSGLLTKTGIYGILLILMSFTPSLLTLYIFGAVALITALTGVFHALAETDIKRILAWSSIENIGIIGLGIVFAWFGRILNIPSIALLGILGALLHCVNHSLFKPMLFYLSGNIQHQVHDREINHLGGLQKLMPVTGVLFFVGSIAIAGLPLMNGFISEFLVFLSILKGFRVHDIGFNIAAIIGLSGLAYVASIALFAFARMYGLTFLGVPRSQKATNAKETKYELWIVPIVLSTLCLFGGLAGDLMLSWIYGFLPKSLQTSNGDFVAIIERFQSFRIVIVIAVVLFIALYAWRRLKVKAIKADTWGCGYEKPSSRMQYTATSFVQPVEPILNVFTGKKRDLEFDNEHFPTKLSLTREVSDRVQNTLIKPLVRIINRFLDLFAGVQSGKTQVYITYGLVFLLVVLIWVIVGES